MKTLSQRIWLF